MIATENEELNKEKKEQSCNMIIHWREKNKVQWDDVLFVNNIIQHICGNVTPKLISCISRSKDNKKKPVKLILYNEQDKKDEQWTKLNLTGNTENKIVSITEDYTVSERQMIKKFANKSTGNIHLNCKTQTLYGEFEELGNQD